MPLPDSLTEGFRDTTTASVADAVDALCGRRGYMHFDIQARIGDHTLVGPAVTVLEGPATESVPPTHAIELIDAAEPGSVIVIATADAPDLSVWGGLMTAGASARGLAGAVLDAGVRDVREIRRDYDFPVFARHVSPGTTVGRYRTMAAGVTVVCGGVEVGPGDIIVADSDGVVVVPRDRAEAVLEAAQEIDRREAEQARLIRDAGGLAAGLAKYQRI